MNRKTFLLPFAFSFPPPSVKKTCFLFPILSSPLFNKFLCSSPFLSFFFYFSFFLFIFPSHFLVFLTNLTIETGIYGSLSLTIWYASQGDSVRRHFMFWLDVWSAQEGRYFSRNRAKL